MTNQVVAATGGNFQSVPEASGLSSMAEQDGFAGLEFDSYGVFPMIVLNQGEFQSADENYGTEFYCTMIRSRPKFLYRTDLPDRNDSRNEVVYSYDNEVTTTGVPLEEIFNSWREKGMQPTAQPQRYVEVTAKMHPHGQLALLSVAQSSIAELSRYWAQLKFKNKQVQNTLTRVFRGKKVERVKNPFYPWAFAEASDDSVM